MTLVGNVSKSYFFNINSMTSRYPRSELAGLIICWVVNGRYVDNETSANKLYSLLLYVESHVGL